MTQYTVQQHETLNSLIARVNEMAQLGWEPIGGIEFGVVGSAPGYPNQVIYLQAMILKETKKSKKAKELK